MDFYRMYIRQKAVKARNFFLYMAIFLSAFILYGVPVGAVLYPAAICVVLGAIFFFFDMQKAKEKHKRLQMLLTSPAERVRHLPDAESVEEQDFMALLEALQQEKEALQAGMESSYRDMVEYYTLWAHQIKTPIASMRLTLQNEDSDMARQLMEELQRIEQYVEMVLVFLRLDSESTDYVFREIDLDRLLHDVVRKFSTQFIRRKIRLSYEPLGVKVLTDEKWLSFVVEQVLSNALKYTPAGGTITLSLQKPLTLCIRDTGMGIAPEDLPRIFEKGYTGYNGRADKKASGIGLYLCRRICRNLGHTITAESNGESGTLIQIDLNHRELQVE